MRLVISPAKKMNVVDDLPWEGPPRYLDRTQVLLDRLRQLSRDEAQALWKCSDALTDLNYGRLQVIDLESGLSPAILAYEGIQYQAMAPSVMTEDELAYLRDHLRILSGFYGVVRPFDGVVPYRLEMQAKLAVAGACDLYGFWGGSLYEALTDPDDGTGAAPDVVVNLASVEYARAVTPYFGGSDGSGGRVVASRVGTNGTVTGKTRAGGVETAGGRANGTGSVKGGTPESPGLLTCLFGTVRNGKLAQKATEAKAARGSFVRWCAERAVENPAELRRFDAMGFALDEGLSTAGTLVFVR